MRSLIAICVAASASAISTPDPLSVEFMQWISQHNRSYGTAEEYGFRF
jgi:hypothetical protein